MNLNLKKRIPSGLPLGKTWANVVSLPLNTPDASVDYTSITQDQLVQEKGWELVGEYSRWFDLVRLQKVEEVVAKKDPKDLQPLGPIKYFIPLPGSETLVNSNLVEGN